MSRHSGRISSLSISDPDHWWRWAVKSKGYLCRRDTSLKEMESCTLNKDRDDLEREREIFFTKGCVPPWRIAASLYLNHRNRAIIFMWINLSWFYAISSYTYHVNSFSFSAEKQFPPEDLFYLSRCEGLENLLYSYCTGEFWRLFYFFLLESLPYNSYELHRPVRKVTLQSSVLSL